MGIYVPTELNVDASYHDNVTNQYIWLPGKNNIIDLYLSTSMAILGLILNIISFIIFSDKKFVQLMYKYLKMESIFIITNLIFQSFRPIYYLKSDWISTSYIANLYEFYVLEFFVSPLEMTAIIMRILSTLDFCISIKKINSKKNFLSLFSYKLVTAAVFLISVLLFIYLLFTRKILQQKAFEIDKNNKVINERTIYLLINSDFAERDFKKIYEQFIYFTRDGLLLIILITMNILICLLVNKSIKKKKYIIETSSTNTNSKIKNIKKGSKLSKKSTLMILITNLNFLFGRIPILVAFVIKNNKKWDDNLAVFCSLAVFFVYVSCMFNFFLFYIFNNRFKKLLKKKLCCFI
jgi:hypothetical protein